MSYVNKKLIELNEYLKNRKVAIIGLGVSNLPLLDYMHKVGAKVTVFDNKNIEDIPKETMEAIEIPVFAITSTVPVGSKVIAVGAPNGVMNSVMIGSVVKSNIPTSVIDNQISLFLTDITLSQKSNGIIINSKGKVIGFIYNSFSEVTGESGIGFIGISSIMDIINRISMGKDVPYFGI